MIKEKTVFVFGAGLSSEYGYPTDQKLRDKIIDDLNDIELGYTDIMDDSKIVLLHGVGFAKTDLVRFRDGLRKGGFDTIDQFLEERTGDRMMINIGKTVIALALFSYENRDKFGTQFTGNCFYRFLLNKLAKGVSKENIEDFKKNEITIITYNYDRSFEFFLWDSLIHRYGLEKSVADEIMKSIKIIHIHGMIGKMHWQDPVYVNYGGNEEKVNPEDLLKAQQLIVSFSEIDGSHQNYIQARRAISEAKNVVFVGFGFGDDNLHRLIETKTTLTEDKNIVATAYGVDDVRIGEISKLTEGILDHKNMIDSKASTFGKKHLDWL